MLSRGHLSPTQQKVILAVIFVFLLSLWLLRTIYIPIFVSYFLAFLLLLVYALKKSYWKDLH